MVNSSFGSWKSSVLAITASAKAQIALLNQEIAALSEQLAAQDQDADATAQNDHDALADMSMNS